MKKSEIKELYHITHIENLASILEKGLLSHKCISKIPHRRIDNKEVQDKREKKNIPRGKELQEYVPLYLSARNPMLYYLCFKKNMRKELCVLRLNSTILDIPGAIITDHNAACSFVRFFQ